MLAVLFHRLGPYHHARLKALNARGDLTAIEFSKVDNTYAWDQVTADSEYRVDTLFFENDIDTLPVRKIIPIIEKTLEDLSLHCVAIPGWSSPASLIALVWCLKEKIPAILMSESTAHDECRIWWKEWIKSRVVRLFSAAIVSGSPQNEYVCTLGISREKIFSGYGAIDNDYFSTEARKVRADSAALRRRHELPDHYFLASNRFIEKKNLSRLLDAYESYVLRAGAAAWDLVLLGDGELKSAVMAQASGMGLTDRVRFPGFKQYDELPVYYGLASAFVQASTTEQWGLVVNEAMAAGLPVIVSKSCGCAFDLVVDGINGFIFDPYNIKELADRLLQISNGSCSLESMGQASRNIINRWSPDTFAKSMMKVVSAALSNPLPRAGLFDRVLLWALMRR